MSVERGLTVEKKTPHKLPHVQSFNIKIPGIYSTNRTTQPWRQIVFSKIIFVRKPNKLTTIKDIRIYKWKASDLLNNFITSMVLHKISSFVRLSVASQKNEK